MKMMKITKRKDEKTDQQLTPQQEEALAKKEIEQYRRETSEQLSRYEEEQKREIEQRMEQLVAKARAYGMSDEELRQALQQAIYCKPQEHHFKAASYEEKDSRAMYQVGG